MTLVVAITGASGVIYAWRLLEELAKRKVETHLVISRNAERVIRQELDLSRKRIEKLASHIHDVDDLNSPLSSGSFKANGMVVIPCSMKTLAGIACGYSENLILRAADVVLKEGRRLVLVPRETPLNTIHLENMLKLARQGVVMVPAMPAFYHKPENVDSLVNYVVGKVLDVLGFDNSLFKRWVSL